MSRLIRIFTVCLVNLFFIQIIKVWHKQGRYQNLAERPNLPEFTQTSINPTSDFIPPTDISKWILVLWTSSKPQSIITEKFQTSWS